MKSVLPALSISCHDWPKRRLLNTICFFETVSQLATLVFESHSTVSPFSHCISRVYNKSSRQLSQKAKMAEKLPMKDDMGGEPEEQFRNKREVFVITRTKAIILLVIVVLLIIFVGVISGVFSAKKARKDALKEHERKNGQGNAPTTAITAVAPTEPTGPEPWYKIRLPQNIRPIHYDLYLDPYLEQNTFQGNVSILIEVTAKSEFMSYILIHINEMNVTEAKVYKQSDAKYDTPTLGDEVALKRTFEYPRNDFFIFELENELEIGRYILQMSYKAMFSSELNGLYISTYNNEKGEKR